MATDTKALLDANGKPIKCSEITYGIYYGGNHCSHNAKVFRPASSGDGHYYCLMHDPVRKAEKRAAQHAKWDAAREETARVYKERRAGYAQEIVACYDYDQALTLFDRIRRGGGYY